MRSWSTPSLLRYVPTLSALYLPIKLKKVLEVTETCTNGLQSSSNPSLIFIFSHQVKYHFFYTNIFSQSYKTLFKNLKNVFNRLLDSYRIPLTKSEAPILVDGPNFSSRLVLNNVKSFNKQWCLHKAIIGTIGTTKQSPVLRLKPPEPPEEWLQTYCVHPSQLPTTHVPVIPATG